MSSDPRFAVNPTLRHFTPAIGWIRLVDPAGIAPPSREPGRSPQNIEKTLDMLTQLFFKQKNFSSPSLHDLNKI